MTDPNDRPTVTERYQVAVGRGGDRDVILAAALRGNRVGVLLLRLQAEYDMVRGDLERAGQIRARNIGAGRELLAAAKTLIAAAKVSKGKGEEVEAAYLERRAEALRKDADSLEKQRTPHEIKSARAFILLELKSLHFVKQEVGALAVRMAAKRHVKTEAALKLAGRVLDVFLDAMCHECDGTGKLSTLYQGKVEKQCGVCCGTGSRRDVLGNNATENTFAGILHGELDRQTKAAARQISQALRGDAGGESGIDAALRARLVELGSVEAAAD